MGCNANFARGEPLQVVHEVGCLVLFASKNEVQESLDPAANTLKGLSREEESDEDNTMSYQHIVALCNSPVPIEDQQDIHDNTSVCPPDLYRKATSLDTVAPTQASRTIACPSLGQLEALQGLGEEETQLSFALYVAFESFS